MFDAAGRAAAYVDALGNRTSFAYDSASRRVGVTNALGFKSTTVFNADGQTVANVNALGNRTSFGYDVAGRNVSVTNALGNVSTTVYDAAGRPIAGVNALGYRTTNSYDRASQGVSTIDANGNITTNVFDISGRRTAVVSALGHSTTSYDAANQTTALQDGRGNRYSFSYDVAGQQLAMVDPLGRITTSGYDAAGQKTLRLDARGNRTTYSFDVVGQPTLRLYPNNSRHTFAYDAVGNRVKMQDTTGLYTYSFDVLNRQSMVVNGFSKTLTYTYDQIWQRSTMVAPETGSFTYGWNAVGQLASMVSPLGERTTFTNDAAGRRTLQQNSNGTRASYSYDRADQLLQLFHLKSDNSVLLGFSYANDPVGNRMSVLESTGDRVTWSYDRTYQLTTESRSGANAYNTTFVYDSVGNRLVQNATGALTTYVYDVANQLVTHKDSTGTTTYVFDATGNQQVVIAPAGTRTTTTWDYENQPTQFQDQTGVLQTAKYTAEQLRAEKVASGTTTKFLWDGPRYVAEFDGTNAVKLLYSGEPTAYGSIYSQSSKSGAIWTPRQFHADCIGSVRSITDSAALVTDTRTFAAFGTAVASSGSTVAALKFCGAHGYYWDLGTQYYVRARVYQSLFARWLSIDPMKVAMTSPHSYKYALANPLKWLDPSGLVACSQCCCCVDEAWFDDILRYQAPLIDRNYQPVGGLGWGHSFAHYARVHMQEGRARGLGCGMTWQECGTSAGSLGQPKGEWWPLGPEDLTAATSNWDEYGAGKMPFDCPGGRLELFIEARPETPFPQDRTTKFAVSVTSESDCCCPITSITVFATQRLKAKDGVVLDPSFPVIRDDDWEKWELTMGVSDSEDPTTCKISEIDPHSPHNPSDVVIRIVSRSEYSPSCGKAKVTS